MVGYKSIKMDFKPYIQDIISLTMALFVCFGLYKYRQTIDIQWFKYIWYVLAVYFVYDFYSETRIDFWIHHICGLILTLVPLFCPSIINYIIEPIFTTLVIESSSVFLSIKMLMRTYLKQPTTDLNSGLVKILKKIQPVNDVLFLVLFTYTRLYLFSKNILFNSECYNGLNNLANFYMLDKIIILCYWVLGFVNIYWFSIVAKKTLYTIFGYDITKYKPDTNDPFLQKIEEIKNAIGKE